jgi:hypothetical protein
VAQPGDREVWVHGEPQIEVEDSEVEDPEVENTEVEG